MLHLFGHTLDLWATPYQPWQTWTLVFSAISFSTGITGLLWDTRDKNCTSSQPSSTAPSPHSTP